MEHWSWEDWDEVPERYLRSQPILPWQRGSDGKGLITPDGQLHAWSTNPYGEPHHDDVASRQGVDYVAKSDIGPDGATWITFPDETSLRGIDRDSAEQLLDQLAPQHGLRFIKRTISKATGGTALAIADQAHRAEIKPVGSALHRGVTRTGGGFLQGRNAAERDRTWHTIAENVAHNPQSIPECPTCGDPLKGEYGTFCPRCQWSEMNVNLDHDPLSNPPDPTVDMHKGIQAKIAAYFHVAPTVERERIRTHGLQPADPAQNWATFQEGDAHPEGVYMFTDRDRADAFRTMLEFRRGQPHDIWGIDESAEANQDPEEWIQDPDIGGSSRYVTQPVYPHLVEGPEHREDMSDYMQPQYRQPTDPWKRGPYPLAEGEGRGRPYPANDSQAWTERVGMRKRSDKLHDFLMNPKSRPDLQTPEGLTFLQALEQHYHNEKTDSLMPWLTREWKKGRLGLDPHAAGHDIPRLIWKDPETATDLNPDGRRTVLNIPTLNHWADFYHANHPVRQQLGDLMRHNLPSFSGRVRAWDEAMADAAKRQALEGGRVVHTTPDNWTVRQLTTPEELTAEGDSMGHCVGGYGAAVQNGRSLIYSLRDPIGQPHATTEITPEQYEWTDSVGTVHRGPHQDFGDDGPLSHPVPHGGRVVQIQGKSNQEPIDEYKARLADWFRSFPPEERPTWGYGGEEDLPALYDPDGYSHWSIDHPDLIPMYEEQNGGLAKQTEPQEDAYGIIRQPANREADYDELLAKMPMHEVNWNTYRPSDKHIQDIYRLARERGEIPELAHALEGYQESQDEDFQNYVDMNYEYAPRYVDPDDPHGWENEDGDDVDEDEGRPYWEPEGPQRTGFERYYDPEAAAKAYEEAMDEWTNQHGGLNAVGQLYKLVNQHYGPHPETGQPGYWNEVQPQPPQPPQTFSSTIPSHRWGKWFGAVEDLAT